MKLPNPKTVAAAIGVLVDVAKWGWRVFGPERPPAPAPMPWGHRDVERARRAANCAGHETEPQCAPPPGRRAP